MKKIKGTMDIWVFFSIVVIMLLAVLAIASLKQYESKNHHGRLAHKEQVKVYHLKDGRSCYRKHTSNGDLWFWLYIMNSNQYYYSNTANYNSLPSGVTWVSSNTVPTIESSPLASLITEAEATVDTTIACDARGMPEVDADGNIVDPDQLAPDEPFDSNDATDGENDAGSADNSGGGDNGGGDGG